MAFADWKNRSKLFADTQRRLNAYTPITEICRAAYKAGERDGLKQLPDVLFDVFAVLQALDAKAKARTSAENVSDVLDAVVRLMRSNAELKGRSGEAA